MPGLRLEVYEPGERKVSGAGPPVIEPVLRSAEGGRPASGEAGTEVVDAVPVTSGEQVLAVVRASEPRSATRHRILLSWLGLAGLCLLAAASAAALASWQSRRLTRPLTALAAAAGRLGDGDFSSGPTVSSVPEIDIVSDTLSRTARRLADTIESERAFNVHASHQLRTPLTQLRLELETAMTTDAASLRAVAESCIATVDQLEHTIDDVLALARGTARERESFDIEPLLEECRSQWAGPLGAVDRPLRMIIEESLAAKASPATTRQILHVFLDNAYRHGSGRSPCGHGPRRVPSRSTYWTRATRWRRHRFSPATPPPASGCHSRARLPSARGGRMLRVDEPAGTRFTLLLPAADEERAGSAHETSWRA